MSNRKIAMQSYEKEGKLKLNDAVEILGIMSKAPDVASLQMNAHAHTEDYFMDEAMAARPLPSQVKFAPLLIFYAKEIRFLEGRFCLVHVTQKREKLEGRHAP